MAIKHEIVLSTTEPNNEIGLLKIRQADEETQKLVVTITENGIPKSYAGLEVFFCAKLGQTAGLGIIEQKLESNEMTSPGTGQLEYTLRDEDWQQLGRQTAYFSFRKMKNAHEWTEQFSTRDFTYNVTKNVFSEGVTEVKKDGSTYIWTIEDLIRLFKEYIQSGKNDWEEFVEQNREVLESVDPGGAILTEIINARKTTTGSNSASVGKRIDTEVDNLKKIILERTSDDSDIVLDYMMVSLTVGDAGVNKPTDFEWRHVKHQDATATLCVMVGLTDATDSKPSMIADSLVQSAVNDGTTAGVKIDMLKPHLGVNYKDSFARKNHAPADLNLFFENWKAILLHYAAFCEQNDIPILCIGCEQYGQMQTQAHATKWINIINTLNTAFPNVKLTYACTGDEIQTDAYMAVAGKLDIIGTNIYLNYFRGSFVANNPTKEMVAESFSWTFDQILRYVRNYPEKPVLITEIGCMPVDYGLSAVVPFNYQTELTTNPNYDVVMRLMQAAFTSIFSIPFICGFSWWHTLSPFVYFRDDYETSAEKYMREEIRRVRENSEL